MSQAGVLRFKPYVPKDQAADAQAKQKRKREPVPDDLRKRTRRACDVCRTKKERCFGGFPCHRCVKEKITCRVNAEIRGPEAAQPYETFKLPTAERMRCLEKLLAHCLGESAIRDADLESMVQSLDHHGTDHAELTEANSDAEEDETFTVDVLPDNRRYYSGENSLLNFSRKLGQKIGEPMNGERRVETKEQSRRGSSAPPTASLHAALQAMPSPETAYFLAETFMLYVQTNNYFVEEGWLNDKIRKCYERPSTLSVKDIPGMVTMMLTLAMGSQFIPMRARCSQGETPVPITELPYPDLGSQLYEHATTLLPEVIKAASFESVQAIMMFAVYLFPIDLPGLAYTYFGLALHMAIKNGMHRKKSRAVSHSPLEREMQVRVWWSLYTLLLRTQIYHGHPRTLAPSDVDTERPHLLSSLDPLTGPSNFHNQCLLIDITILLDGIATDISALRRTASKTPFVHLLVKHQKLVALEEKLPTPSPATPPTQLRLDIHLCLHYYHSRLFLGRPFLLTSNSSKSTTSSTTTSNRKDSLSATSPSTTTSSTSPASTSTSSAMPPPAPTTTRLSLPHDAIHSAIHITRLCTLLATAIGLAQSSYAVEFTCCRAATLVLIAARVVGNRSPDVLDALGRGMDVLRQWAGDDDNDNNDSADNNNAGGVGGGAAAPHENPNRRASEEARVVERFRRAIGRLERAERAERAERCGDADTDTAETAPGAAREMGSRGDDEQQQQRCEWEVLWKERTVSASPAELRLVGNVSAVPPSHETVGAGLGGVGGTPGMPGLHVGMSEPWAIPAAVGSVGGAGVETSAGGSGSGSGNSGFGAAFEDEFWSFPFPFELGEFCGIPDLGFEM